MKIKIKLITILVGLVLMVSQIFLSPQEVSAAQPSVKLSGVKGDVIIKVGGGLREFPAVEGMELVQGDWLRTGKTGTAKLSYEDGTEATIGSSSYLNIQRLTTRDTTRVSSRRQARITAWQDGHQSSVELWSGSIWNKVKSLVNMDDKYEIETPTAVMGVRGTLYLVSVDQETGSTQSDVVDGAVGVAQNAEETQAAPIQIVTMGKTLKLASLTDPLPDNQVINQQELIKNTQPEILAKLINDIIERTKEMADTIEEQQLTFGLTGVPEDIISAIGTSYKLADLASFGQEFMDNLQNSNQLEEVKQVLKENNQSIEELQTTIDTIKTESEATKSQVVETATIAGVSQEQINSIGNQATGVSSIPASETTPTTPTTPITPTTPTTPTTPPSSGGGGGGGDGDDSSDDSSTTTVISTDYTVNAEIISNVPKGTSKATFLANLAKGENHQAWDTSGVNDPVLSNDTIVVTAQNGQKVTYIILLAPVELKSIAITTPATRLRYKVGETLDLSGLVVTGTNIDDSTQIEPVTAANVTGFDSTAPAASQTLTITIEGKTTSYTITITKVELKSIAITTPATKLRYKVGETLDLSGLVITGTNMDDSAQIEPVTAANVTGFDSTAPVASQTLTITIGGKTTSYIITITKADLKSIAITTPATKLTYKVGESLDLNGLVVTGTNMDDSTQIEPVTAENVSGFDSTALAASQTLTITIGEKTTSFTIKVVELDKDKPVITLTGSQVVNLANGASYTDAGATAIDNVDGVITGRIVTTITNNNAESTLDTTVAGAYIYHYNVNDAAGNKADEVMRTVVVAAVVPVPVPVPTTITISGSNSVIIPISSTDSTSVIYNVEVKDQNGQIMSGQNITWSLDSIVTGVSIDQGVVYVAFNAIVGSDFIIVATVGSISGSKTISLVSALNSTISTVTSVVYGAVNPSVVITVANDTFTAAFSMLINNWMINTGTTDLAVDTISRTDATHATINFIGTATAGTITISAKDAALKGAVASNSINVIVSAIIDTIPPSLSSVGTSVVIPSTLAATSNETGFLYLVLKSGARTTKADLDAQLSAGTPTGTKVATVKDIVGAIPTTGLVAGIYVVYGVDLAGNISAASDDVTVGLTDRTLASGLTVISQAATTGKTLVMVMETPGESKKLSYKNFHNDIVYMPYVGEELSWTDLPVYGESIYAANGDNIVVVEIDIETHLVEKAGQTVAVVTSQDGDYTYTVEASKAILTKYTGAGGDVAIPSTLGGYPLISIDGYAFSYCTGLTTVNIPEGVTSIGHQAFTGCTGLTTINISEGVTSIGWGAFTGCKGLTAISIPEGVTSISTDVFNGCSGLISITVAVGNLNYMSIGGILFNEAGTILLACPGGLTTASIPEGVTSIGRGAFSDCIGLTDISISGSVTDIGNHAFYNCRGLTTVDIPEGVTNIGDGAFYNCRGLTTIQIPEGVTNIGVEAFSGCIGLTTLSIPENVTIISALTFTSCTSLTSISIPPGVTSIGDAAFQYCTGLTTVSIPEGVTSIGDGAFRVCTGLSSITINSATTIIYDSAETIPTTTKIIGYDPSTAKDYATNSNHVRQFEVIVGALTVLSVEAVNGTLIVTLSGVPTVAPVINDFRVIQFVNGSPVSTTPTAITIDASVVTLTVPLIIPTTDDQIVYSTVSYKSGVAVETPDAFTVFPATALNSTAPLATNIAVTNNNGAADTVVVSNLAVDDIVTVYDLEGAVLGTATAAGTSATVSIAQLGTGAGNVYVTVKSTGKTESTPITTKAYPAEAFAAGDATALNAMIAAVATAELGKTEGTEVGNQVVGSKATLDAAKDAAQVVATAAATKTQAELDVATATLNAAITAYNNAVVAI